MTETTNWQDNLLEQEDEVEDEKSYEKIRDIRWYDNVSRQIERTGQACLAY